MDDKKKSYTEEDIKSAIDFGRDAEAGVIEFDYKNFENLHQQFLNKTDVKKYCLIKKEQYIEVIGLLENISNWGGDENHPVNKNAKRALEILIYEEL